MVANPRLEEANRPQGRGPALQDEVPPRQEVTGFGRWKLNHSSRVAVGRIVELGAFFISAPNAVK